VNKPASLQIRRTPLWLYHFLDERFGPFALDAAAEESNALCEHWLGEAHDALTCAWAPKTFCNPPFKTVGLWVHKAAAEAKKGYMVLMFAPQGGSQTWYHKIARRYTILQPDMRISYDLPNGLPTGVDKCHHGQSNTECRKSCKCVNGADRDTSFLLMGPGFENPNYDDGQFQMLTLNLRPAFKIWQAEWRARGRKPLADVIPLISGSK